MDRWIIAETKSVCLEITKRLENYQPDKATIAVEDFINLLSNWYVRRNRKRFWKPGKFGTDTPFDNCIALFFLRYSRLSLPWGASKVEMNVRNKRGRGG